MYVALSLPLDDERRLSDSAPYYGHEVAAACSGGDELAVRLGQLPITVAIVAATEQHLTPRLIEAADMLGIRMVVVAQTSEQKRHAMRLGIRETFDQEAAWPLVDVPVGGATSAVADALPGSPARLSRSHADQLLEAPQPRRRGRVIAVWGPQGAPGRTTVAIALAAELAATGRRVAVVDADTHAASVAPALGLLDESPGFAAACRLVGIGGLDQSQFERIAQPVRGARGSFRVLTGIGRASRWPELGAKRVAGVLDALRAYVDVIVVDVAASVEQDEEFTSDVAVPHRNAAALEVLRSADNIVALAAADPVGISRFLRARADVAELVESERVTTVITKVRASAIGINPGGQVKQTLARLGGVGEVHQIPWDPAAFDAALLSGKPVTDVPSRSGVKAAVRELAAALDPVDVSRERRGKRRRRIA